jgi:hypothetical protein
MGCLGGLRPPKHPQIPPELRNSNYVHITDDSIAINPSPIATRFTKIHQNSLSLGYPDIIKANLQVWMGFKFREEGLLCMVRNSASD